MLRWNNDYNHGAHPTILQCFEQTNDTAYPGYGTDEMCEAARKEIIKYLDNDQVDIHFLIGGTQVNYTMIAAALRPYQGVVCADSAHIHVHETGAVENTGHKLLALPGVEGKLTAEAIRAEAEGYRASGVQEHITQPKFVFLSHPSEYGTIYSKKELTDIRSVCDEYGLYLYVDGARMGYGLGADSSDVTLADFAKLADAFYIGGTKCGALFGEALVIGNDALKDHFRSYMKQNGALLAKGWLLGLQFYTLFKDGLYFDITKHADKEAMRIRDAFRKKGIPFYIESNTNQQFVILTNEQMAKIGEKHIFEYESKLDDAHHVVRFCTSWSTKTEDVDVLLTDIEAL